VIGIDPLYFLDEMSIDELSSICKARYEAEKKSWEQTRLICFYNIISMNGTKTYKKPSDLFKLEWDKKTKTRALTKDEAIAKIKDMQNGKG